MDKFIIIGTAGRDKTKAMTLALWQWMIRDVRQRVPKGSHVVSGGAAWADHLAVSLFLFGHASRITLHLPAPFVFSQGQFATSDDPHDPRAYKSPGGTANYYHRRFSEVIERDTLGQIGAIVRRYYEGLGQPSPIEITTEPVSSGYGGMFARNAKVAAHTDAHMLAYTFGEGDEPADGGTKHTWDRFTGTKTHIPLPVPY